MQEAFYTPNFQSPYTAAKSKPCAELAMFNRRTYLENRTRGAGFVKFAEILCAKANPSSARRCLQQVSIVKPYYDVNDVLPAHLTDTTVLDNMQSGYVAIIVAMLSSQPGGEHVTPADVHVATRHGLIFSGLGNTFKVSFRFFVTGVSTTLLAMRAIIEQFGHGKRFDLSVYSKSRKMCVVFGCKSYSNKRLLLPTDDPEAAGFDALRYMIQHTDPLWAHLVESMTAAKRARLTT